MAVIERKNIGPSGLADVRILARSVRVTFQEPDGKVGETYDLPLDSVEEGRKSGMYLVQMTAAKDKLYLHPPGGEYMLKFKQIGGRVNGVPMSKVRPERIGTNRKTGKPFPIPAEIVYTIVVQVVGGIYEGLTSTTQVPYSFRASATGVGCDFYDSARNLRITEQVFRVVGGIDIANDNVPFFENPSTQLLYIERAFLEADRTFKGTLNDKGFLDAQSLSIVPENMQPKKKTTKKGSK